MKRGRLIKWLAVGGVVAATVLLGVAYWSRTRPATDEGDTVINITYPYVASPERQNQIRHGFPNLQPGATSAQVRDSLGVPDEVRPLYEPQIKNPRRTGTTYWYFLAKASVDRTIESPTVRVSFDLENRLTGVDHWAIEDGPRVAPVDGHR